MSCQQFSTIFSILFSPETEYSTYGERHQQHPGEVEGRHQQGLAAVGRQRRREVELHNPLASAFVLWNLSYLERDLSYEERHQRHLVVVEGRHRQQLVVGLNTSLASVFFLWNLRVLERDLSYEGRRLRQPVVVAAHLRHQGAELNNFLAWTSV